MATSGCTKRYRPAEYVIATDRIGAFPSEGAVRVIGEPAQAGEVRVFSQMGYNWMSSYAEITAALVAQLTKELTKRGVVVSDTAPKTIRVTVLEMTGRSGFATLEGAMTVRVQLGDALPMTLHITNKSPANIYRALNGAIARTVIAILTNSDVQEYLAGTSAAGMQPAGSADQPSDLP